MRENRNRKRKFTKRFQGISKILSAKLISTLIFDVSLYFPNTVGSYCIRINNIECFVYNIIYLTNLIKIFVDDKQWKVMQYKCLIPAPISLYNRAAISITFLHVADFLCQRCWCNVCSVCEQSVSRIRSKLKS